MHFNLKFIASEVPVVSFEINLNTGITKIQESGSNVVRIIIDEPLSEQEKQEFRDWQLKRAEERAARAEAAKPQLVYDRDGVAAEIKESEIDELLADYPEGGYFNEPNLTQEQIDEILAKKVNP